MQLLRKRFPRRRRTRAHSGIRRGESHTIWESWSFVRLSNLLLLEDIIRRFVIPLNMAYPQLLDDQFCLNYMGCSNAEWIKCAARGTQYSRLVFGNSLFSGSRLSRSYSVHDLRIFPEATHCDLSQKMGSLYAFLCCFKCTLGEIHQSLGFLSNFWPDLWLHRSIQIEITSNGIDGILSEFPLLVTSSSLYLIVCTPRWIISTNPLNRHIIFIGSLRLI